MRKLALLLLAFASFQLFADPGEPAVPPPQKIVCCDKVKKFDYMLLLIQKRLAVMHEVARYKWNKGIPVEDRERELAQLHRLVAQAETYGIPADWAESFIQAQMDAAKLMQHRDFEIWAKEGRGSFDRVDDLYEVTRPYLDILTDEIFSMLAYTYSHFAKEKSPCLSVQPPLSVRPADAIPVHIWEDAVRPIRESAATTKQLSQVCSPS